MTLKLYFKGRRGATLILIQDTRKQKSDTTTLHVNHTLDVQQHVSVELVPMLLNIHYFITVLLGKLISKRG